MNITTLQLHKRASYEFKYIQDKYDINLETRTFAVADGTTQSFNSELWADIITREFVHNPTFDSKVLIQDFTKQVEEYKSSNFEYSTNFAKASLEKAKQSIGGTATFIGLKFQEHNKIDIIVCGDTNFFICNEGKITTMFPFTDVDSLDKNSQFINTEQLKLNKVGEDYFKHKSIEYKLNDVIIIATDALSRLILKYPAVLEEIVKIENFEQLQEFCRKYWESKQLQEDDITALIIPVKNAGEVKIIQPPQDFSFPMEPDEEFVPFVQKKKETPQKNNDLAMNEILKQFGGVAEDFIQVKKTLQLHKYLLITVISLLLVNFGFLIYPNIKKFVKIRVESTTSSDIRTNLKPAKN